MALTKVERREALELIEKIEGIGWGRRDGEWYSLKTQPELTRLRRIIDQPSHGEGNEHLTSNESSLSWERLLSMRNEAMSLWHESGSDKLYKVLLVLEEEISRRLEKVAGINETTETSEE